MKKPSDTLREAADLYAERNELYGDTYKMHGQLVAALFPDGVHLRSISDHNRFGVLTMIMSKLCRYTQNFYVGGHDDSALDSSVYWHMLMELDRDADAEALVEIFENGGPNPAEAATAQPASMADIAKLNRKRQATQPVVVTGSTEIVE